MKQKRLKIAILVFALTFVVGAAFAATNGVLAFGGTVRINNVAITDYARLEVVVSEGGRVAENASARLIASEGETPGSLWIDFEITDPVAFRNGGWQLGLTAPMVNTGNAPAVIHSVAISEGPHPRISLFNRGTGESIALEDAIGTVVYPGDASALFVNVEVFGPDFFELLDLIDFEDVYTYNFALQFYYTVQ